ncbi:fatty acid transporter FAT2, partial [Fusarium pseudocircinatum]
MALTLQTAIDKSNPLAEAIIVPSKPKALTISYSNLEADVSAFQRKLADLGITKSAPVSIALVNSYEFIV